MTKTHDFHSCLEFSHAAASRPEWIEIYRKAFPLYQSSDDLRHDGDHQRAGIDRKINFSNGDQTYVDEKVRGYKIAADPASGCWQDIFLETLSDRNKKRPGWVIKPLRAHWIAYLIAPIGECYLLPVQQLQSAWSEHGAHWTGAYRERTVKNRSWVTIGVPVPVNVLFKAIGQQLRIRCNPFDPGTGLPVPPRSARDVIPSLGVTQEAGPVNQPSIFELARKVSP